MTRDIFISYSRNDQAIVLPYVQQISKAIGRNCWIDLKGVESGVEFEEVIINAIDDCKVVLFMLSDNSLHSKWTKREVIYAEGEGKRIVPVLVDGEQLRGWFKFHFGNVDYIDIRSEEQKTKLVENLKTWLEIEEDKLETKRNVEHIVPNNPDSSLYVKYLQPKWGKIRDVWKSLSPFVKWMTSILIFSIIILFIWAFQSRITEDRCGGNDLTVRIVKNGWGKYGLRKTTGKVIVACKWEATGALFYEGLLRVKDNNGRWGFVDETGKLVISYDWISADDFSEGLAAVQNYNGKWGYIDNTGKIVIPCKWESAFSFGHGLASVKDDNGMCVIDKTGLIVKRE